MFVSSFLFLVFIHVAYSESWNITVELNPQCVVDCSSFNIVHAVGKCSNSSVHFLFAASNYIGPSVLALQSNKPDAVLSIDWDRIANDTSLSAEAIKLDGVQHSYATVFTNLVNYNDTQDLADLAATSTDDYQLYQFNQLHWQLSTTPWVGAHELKNDEIFHVAFVGDSSDSAVFSSNGSIKLEFMLSSAHRHNPQLPRLRFVPGLTMQFELHLAGLLTNYSRGRFATQLALISQDPLDPAEDFVQTASVSINDEVTPGIFEMIDIHLNERTHSNTSFRSSDLAGGAFVQTRPVCYVSDANRQVSTSRDVRLSPRRDRLRTRSSSLARSLPYWFYGKRLADAVGIRVQNVSFGTPGDGYYANSKYVVWSASFGFGHPPVDSLSALLIGLISLSVVVILASGLFGTVVLVVLRLRSRHGTDVSRPLLEPDPVA